MQQALLPFLIDDDTAAGHRQREDLVLAGAGDGGERHRRGLQFGDADAVDAMDREPAAVAAFVGAVDVHARIEELVQGLSPVPRALFDGDRIGIDQNHQVHLPRVRPRPPYAAPGHRVGPVAVLCRGERYWMKRL